MRWKRDTTDDAGTQRLGEVGKNEAKPQDPEEGEAHASSHQALGYQTPAAMYFGNWNAHEQTERGDTMGRPTCESLLLGLPDYQRRFRRRLSEIATIEQGTVAGRSGGAARQNHSEAWEKAAKCPPIAGVP
jgi:hypothetical protein